jgi:5-methylcytosine-specific restriction endonuclease McrA
MTCQYCGEKFKLHQLTIDHIIPRVHGGRSTWDNVVASCKKCNGIKGCKSLEDCGMKLLKKPTKPKWINPVSKRSPEHICKSWTRFLKNMDTSDNLVT